jgi:hypothetical protein
VTKRKSVLSFITSLRHPATTDDYAGVVALLDATLRSLNAQLERRFEAIVVANEPYTPPGDLDFPVESVQVGFARPPRESATKDAKHDAIKLDKGLKLAVAMARSHGTHAMCLDADDFVSRRVTSYVAEHADEKDGWYVERGIRYDVPTGLFRPQRHFNDVCGTSLIWRRGLMPDVTVPADPTPDEVLEAYGVETITEELGSHRTLRRRYAFAPLPFPAAVYAVHGHNHAPGASMRLGLPIGRRRAAEYGIVQPPVARTYAAAAAQLRPTRIREVAGVLIRANRDRPGSRRSDAGTD